ncbi:MAG TPA: PTS sugar transporter subunit IIA [Gemmatimonadales bacterium]|nr:PTS sugar transporter subunit IIA [Gemmatimonadales bacterium]
MLLSEFLPADHVRLPILATDKISVLRELTEFLAARDGGDMERLHDAVAEREAVLSTGIGHGVAVPHGRSEVAGSLTVVAGRTGSPVPFDASDGQPVRLVFLVVGPPADAGRHIQVLGRIARLARRADLRERLLAVESAGAFAAVIKDSEET